jgi:hypothetical protein
VAEIRMKYLPASSAENVRVEVVQILFPSIVQFQLSPYLIAKDPGLDGRSRIFSFNITSYHIHKSLFLWL